MLNLIKYELIKQRTSKFALAGFLLLAEIAFLTGILTDNGEVLAFSLVVFFATLFVGFFVLILEAIVTYYNDMKSKQGYMLFMTPHSEYAILGSKLLSSILTIALVVLILGLLGFLDVVIVTASQGTLGELLESIVFFFEQLTQVEVSWGGVALGLITVVFEFIAMLTSAFLIITVFMTFMKKIPARGFLCFVAYLILNSFISRFTVAAMELLDVSHGMGYLGVEFAVTALFAGICFFLSGMILQKKLSL